MSPKLNGEKLFWLVSIHILSVSHFKRKSQWLPYFQKNTRNNCEEQTSRPLWNFREHLPKLNNYNCEFTTFLAELSTDFDSIHFDMDDTRHIYTYSVFLFWILSKISKLNELSNHLISLVFKNLSRNFSGVQTSTLQILDTSVIPN